MHDPVKDLPGSVCRIAPFCKPCLNVLSRCLKEEAPGAEPSRPALFFFRRQHWILDFPWTARLANLICNHSSGHAYSGQGMTMYPLPG